MAEHNKDTRRSITRLLKLKGPMTADELGKHLDISTVGVRGHLISLEHAGIAGFEVERRGVG